MSNEELHDKLSLVDPQTASCLHPNNRRKILRALQVWYQTGCTLSDKLKKQRQLANGSESSVCGPLRYPNTCALWIQCDQTILDQRLDDRVDKMVEKGLKDEICVFYGKYYEDYCSSVSDFKKRMGGRAGQIKGVFQMIGLKEFMPFLTLSNEIRNSDVGKELFNDGVRLLKIATRQYARRQSLWINNRFLQKMTRPSPPVYGLNGSDLEKWDENVTLPAKEIISAFLQDKRASLDPLPLIFDKYELQRNDLYECKVCRRTISGLRQWELHLAGRAHRKLLVAINKRAKNAKALNEAHKTLTVLLDDIIDSKEERVNV